MFSIFPTLLSFDHVVPLLLRVTLGLVFILWAYSKFKIDRTKSILEGIVGNIFDMMNEIKEQKRMNDLLMSSLEVETKMKKIQIQKLMESKSDNYVTPKEAIKLGIVDKIVGQ
jgi:ATP-dependent protease ClpP protease subunit